MVQSRRKKLVTYLTANENSDELTFISSASVQLNNSYLVITVYNDHNVGFYDRRSFAFFEVKTDSDTVEHLCQDDQVLIIKITSLVLNVFIIFCLGKKNNGEIQCEHNQKYILGSTLTKFRTNRSTSDSLTAAVLFCLCAIHRCVSTFSKHTEIMFR